VLDLRLALAKLCREFKIDRLLLEGGSILNGAFQRESFIDELSLVQAPIYAEESDKPLFDEADTQGFALSYYRDCDAAGRYAVYKRQRSEKQYNTEEV